MKAHRSILCILGLGLVCFAYRFSFKNRAAATSVSGPPSEPSALLAYADEMALAGHWLGARAHFAKAEHLFSLKHDEANRLYCAISSVRSNLESSSLPEASAKLNRFLQNSSVQRNPRILIRALVAKGDVEFQLNPPEAYKTWIAVAKLASATKDSLWTNRASGELGAIEFYRGHVFMAMAFVGKALFAAEVHGDLGAQIHLRAVLGEGFLEAHRYPDALNFFQHSIDLAKATPRAEPPFTAQLGRARAFIALGKTAEGISSLKQLLVDSTQHGFRVRQARVLSALSDYYATHDSTSFDAGNIFRQAYELSSRIIRKFTRQCLQALRQPLPATLRDVTKR